MSWVWPLPGIARATSPEGAFGARRRHDMHTGIDLYAPEGTSVVSVEEGSVIAIEAFTGPEASSPWWLPTEAVLVEGPTGVVCYGEVKPLVAVGDYLPRGGLVGEVQRVLRVDKGRPMSMLHLELYTAGVRTTCWWMLNERKPDWLFDPTPFLPETP